MLEIDRDRLYDEIKEDIISLFHPHIQHLLRMCGFKLGRIDKLKKIVLLGDIEDGTHLENQLKQSKIVILPLNDFPDNLPFIEKPDASFSETSRNNSTQSLIQRNSDSENIGLERTSLNSSPTILQSPETSRLSRSRRIQIDDKDEEEECHESEDDQLGM